jgi:N-acetylglutamate synthase-like GNAT family acetyltransferase
MIKNNKTIQMDINLIKASIDDAEEIYKMQIITFKPLLEKYQDYDLNPSSEKIEKTVARLNEEITDYYIIKLKENSIGGIRIRRYEEGNLCKVGPLFILPEYQNRGIAQNVFKIIEKEYNPKNGWILDTILQEKGNCHLYEKIGYKKTGEIKKNERMDIIYYEKKKE